MMREVSRVLRIDGKIVILTAETAPMKRAIEESASLTLLKTFNILLSG
jgi:hypothetical protein